MKRSSIPIVKQGDVIAAYVCGSSGKFISVSSEGRGQERFFLVLGIVSGNRSRLWAVVEILSQVSGGYQCKDRTTRIIPMVEGVRRAAIVHRCDSNCSVPTNSMMVSHSSNLHQGGTYEILTYRNGYPPHAG